MLKIQPFFFFPSPSRSMIPCIERPEGASSLLHLQMLLLGAALEECSSWEEPGTLGSGCLAGCPAALVPPCSWAGGFSLIGTFQPTEIKHLV